MARVPRHFRDKLVSERVGVNTLDTSGADIARSIANMADQFQRIAGKLVLEQRQYTDQSEIASKKAEYLNKSATAAQDLQKSFAESPSEGYTALTQKNQEIKEEVLSSVSDGRLQTQIGASIDGLMAQQSVNNKKWELGRMSAMQQQFLVDVQQMNVDTIMQGATQEEYEIMLGDDTFTEENYKKAWGPEDGVKNFQTAQNAMFRARATTLLENGRFFEAKKFIENSEEPDEKTRREVVANFEKMQKGANTRRMFQTLSSASLDVVETQEGVLADKMTAAQLDDRVLEVSLQAQEAPDAETQQVLLQYANVLADIRDMKMEQILLRAPGNTTVEAGLQAEYSKLIKKEGGDATANSGVYLSDFFAFQEKLVAQARAGNVSADKYGRWMYWSKVALANFTPEGGGWFSSGNLAKGAKLRKVLKNFLDDTEDKSPLWQVEAMREVYDGLPAENIELADEDTIKALFSRGKKVAALKELGLPIDIIDSKVVSTKMGNFNIVDWDQQTGLPIVDVPTENMER